MAVVYSCRGCDRSGERMPASGQPRDRPPRLSRPSKNGIGFSKHLRTVCFCGDENRTGMLLPLELAGLIDYLPTWSDSVCRVVLAISAMTSSHNDDKTLCCRTRRVLLGIKHVLIHDALAIECPLAAWAA